MHGAVLYAGIDDYMTAGMAWYTEGDGCLSGLDVNTYRIYVWQAF